MSDISDCDIINIDKNEFKNELKKHSLYIFYKSLTFISCLFVIIGLIGILIGKLILNNIKYWSLLNTSFILNISMITIIFGVYGIFLFENYILRPIYFSIYFWWTICSLIIFIIFTLIIINWKYFDSNIYYLIFIPIYCIYFYFIYNFYKIYLISKYLSIKINGDNLNIYKKYSISHISIGILINIFFIFLYFIINKLSIIECEFILKNELISHFTLICESTKVNFNDENNTFIYNGTQEIIGKIWIIFNILTILISILSFLTLWKNANFLTSIITQIISLLLSFISCLIWTLFDNICNDQTCLNNNFKPNQHFDLLITKHILFINSITIQIISCLIWCIIIWSTINTMKQYQYKYIPI